MNLMIAAALSYVAPGGRCASAQEKTDQARQAAISQVPVNQAQPKQIIVNIPGQAAAEELEKLYTDLLQEYIDGQGATVAELVQVHQMAIEARELGGRLFQELQIGWGAAAIERASQLARLIEQRYKAGDISQMNVRLARANVSLTKAKHVAAKAVAQSAAQAGQARARRRSVVLPPASK